jgi:hypothetical protein
MDLSGAVCDRLYFKIDLPDLQSKKRIYEYVLIYQVNQDFKSWYLRFIWLRVLTAVLPLLVHLVASPNLVSETVCTHTILPLGYDQGLRAVSSN